jgi:hypothetical protein
MMPIVEAVPNSTPDRPGAGQYPTSNDGPGSPQSQNFCAPSQPQAEAPNVYDTTYFNAKCVASDYSLAEFTTCAVTSPS